MTFVKIINKNEVYESLHVTNTIEVNVILKYLNIIQSKTYTQALNVYAISKNGY